MKKGVLMYRINAFLWLVTILIGYGDVKENLDGWHNFSAGHAIFFVLLCVGMIVLCSYNVKGLKYNAVEKQHYISGVALIALPILFHMVSVNLQGNVETDFQYLILRTFQGLDSMYIWLIIASMISFVFLVLRQFGDAKTSGE